MDILPDYCKKRIVILGCGNTLFGDDGFGPAVVDYLQKNYKFSDDVCIINAGTSVSEILFTIIVSEVRPQKIIIIDAADINRKAGEIFEISLDALQKQKLSYFSLHQFPTSNLLKELKEVYNIEVKIFTSQVENVPNEISPGISDTLKKSIPQMCEMIMKEIDKV